MGFFDSIVDIISTPVKWLGEGAKALGDVTLEPLAWTLGKAGGLLGINELQQWKDFLRDPTLRKTLGGLEMAAIPGQIAPYLPFTTAPPVNVTPEQMAAWGSGYTQPTMMDPGVVGSLDAGATPAQMQAWGSGYINNLPSSAVTPEQMSAWGSGYVSSMPANASLVGSLADAAKQQLVKSGLKLGAGLLAGNSPQVHTGGMSMVNMPEWTYNKATFNAPAVAAGAKAKQASNVKGNTLLPENIQSLDDYLSLKKDWLAPYQAGGM